MIIPFLLWWLPIVNSRLWKFKLNHKRIRPTSNFQKTKYRLNLILEISFLQHSNCHSPANSLLIWSLNWGYFTNLICLNCIIFDFSLISATTEGEVSLNTFWARPYNLFSLTGLIKVSVKLHVLILFYVINKIPPPT